MMFKVPDNSPESNAKVISPEELKAMMEQGKFTVNVIGDNQQMKPTALVILGIVHTLPLNFGWHHGLEKTVSAERLAGFQKRLTDWQRLSCRQN